MPFDAAKLAHRRRRRAGDPADEVFYEVDPDVAYPAMLVELQRLAALEPPEWNDDEQEWAGETPPASLATYVQQARAVPGGVVAAAEGGPFRAQALDIVRLALMAGLHDAAGGKIGVRILRRERWRL